jgi:phenylpropionate dioxygenase-like ring-hydroxylating dioxygenase large terminal subunit
MYKNLWYAAAFSDELANDPLKVRMLSRDFVLFRDNGGRAVCLSNVCPHRGVSLAQGKCFSDGTVQCPQHGWRFGADGRCTMIPSQDDGGPIPAGAKVDAYPTHEEHGVIWTFLGDQPDAAPPVPSTPECDLPGWRTITYSEVWDCNLHWAKFSNIDLVHVPITHGQSFVGCFTPEEKITHPDEYTVASRIVTPVQQPKGSWGELREETKNIVSTLTFFASGFTLKGHVEIGGEGSGIFITFYEMSTPIDDETTQMRFLFARNFMPEAEHDAETLKRNLKNVHEDRALAETQLPRRGPVPPTERDLVIDPDDTLLKGYWSIMDRLREAGHQIDTTALLELDQGHRYCTIPSPARAALAGDWVHDLVPTCAP